MIVSIDFETRSAVDLRASGVYPYAAHDSTSIVCMAWAVDGAEPRIWAPGLPFPEDLRALIKQDCELRAWNAQFERIMWRDCAQRLYADWPTIPMWQWVDTAAEAAAMALPRHLADCAKVLGVSQQKDMAGHRLMMQMCRPRRTEDDGTLVWWDDVDRHERLQAYCMQDVRAEQAIYKRLRRLSDDERAVYLLDQQINDRGVQLDRELVDAARIIVAQGTKRANQIVRGLTNGVSVTQRAKLVAWLQREGVDVTSIAKAKVADLLLTNLTPAAREVLEVRQEAGKSSVAKLDSMVACAGEDNRMRGLLLYHGANTGRWSGKLVQPQNFPRGDVKDVERYIPFVRSGDYDTLDLIQSPIAVVSSMLRSMITAAPGRTLMAGDFSAIEARVLNWCAGQDDVLEAFADPSRDIYRENAARIYDIPLDEVEEHPHRHTGKFQELGCGYAMGPVKAVTAAKDVYGVEITPELAIEIVDSYRERHPAVVDYWNEVERAALRAVTNPGEPFIAGPVSRPVRFATAGKFLWLRLPSGRVLAYAAPRMVVRDQEYQVFTPGENGMMIATKQVRQLHSVEAWSVNSMTRQWQPRSMYGGLWVENIVQAVSRDIMAQAMLRVERAGYPVVLTVHDEIVTEPYCGGGLAEVDRPSLEEFKFLMNLTPEWAIGCPISSKVWQGERYKK